jgi:predicted O-methyltransferase YrrM
MARLMSLLRRFAHTPQILQNISKGISNETRVLNDKLTEIKLAIESIKPHESRRSEPLNKKDLVNAPVPAGGEGNVFSHDLPTLPFPEVNPEENDPVSVIAAATEYQQCAQLLGRLATGLISDHGRALLYSLIRNVKPSLVVEIGSYQAGTSKVICWALAANDHGRLHTIDPFGGDRVPGIIASWPARLREFVRFFAINSMEYFAALSQSDEQPALIFVDGNHDYEFALFDIEAAARAISPGGFIVIDNTSQAGPFLAAQDFLRSHGDWRECGGDSLAKTILDSPFEIRSTIQETDFCVLRAPAITHFTGRPYTSGQLDWESTSLGDIRLSVLDGAPGVLYVQCIIRTFGHATSLGEFTFKRSVEIEKPGEIDIKLDFHLDKDTAKQAVRVTVEPWFVWVGSHPLAVASWILT